MMITMTCSKMALVLASVLLMSQTSVRLNESVSAFWDHLVRNERSQALEFVAKDSRDNFIAERGQVIRAWKLKDVASNDANSAQVTIEVETFSGNGFVATEITDKWILQDGTWKMRVPRTLSTFRGLFERAAETPPQRNVLQVFPDQVRIHFLNRTQLGVLKISNGTSEPVTSVDLDFDLEGFELLDPPPSVPAGTNRLVTFRYRGGSAPKNLKCSVSLRLTQGGVERVFLIPAIVNFVSPGARGLLGLTKERLQALEPGDNPPPTVRPGLPPNEASTNRSFSEYGVDEE